MRDQKHQRTEIGRGIHVPAKFNCSKDEQSTRLEQPYDLPYPDWQWRRPKQKRDTVEVPRVKLVM